MSPVKVVLLEESQVLVLGGSLAVTAAHGSRGREDDLGSVGGSLSNGALDGVGGDGAGNGTEDWKDSLGEHDE